MSAARRKRAEPDASSNLETLRFVQILSGDTFVLPIVARTPTSLIVRDPIEGVFEVDYATERGNGRTCLLALVPDGEDPRHCAARHRLAAPDVVERGLRRMARVAAQGGAVTRIELQASWAFPPEASDAPGAVAVTPAASRADGHTGDPKAGEGNTPRPAPGAPDAARFRFWHSPPASAPVCRASGKPGDSEVSRPSGGVPGGRRPPANGAAVPSVHTKKKVPSGRRGRA